MPTIHRNSDLIEAEIDGDVVMMNPATGDYYGLGSVAGRIWKLLEQPLTEEQIVEVLLEEFEVSETQCRKEVADFIKQMCNSSVVTLGE